MSAGELSAADIGEQPDVLRSVLDRNAEAIVRARSVLGRARAVRLCGIGSSRNAAGYGGHALHVVAGVPAVVLPAPGTTVPLPAPADDEPLVVLSQSGETPALLGFVSSSDFIAITNDARSTLASRASISLDCAAGTERVVAATKSVTAQCLLLRALAGDVSVDALVASVGHTIGLDVSAAIGAEPPASVVSAGFAPNAVAGEIALKFIEMCGVSVRSGSVVEHFHGPVASGAPILAFVDPNDPNSRELAAMERVTTIGADDSFDVTLPALDDPSLQAIVTLVAGQRIAHAWALALGEDPDEPRGLSKVTGTR